jgi:quinohemoprotein ethanol dehydrogenase
MRRATSGQFLSMWRTGFVLLTVVAGLAAASRPGSIASDAERFSTMAEDASNWVVTGGTYAEQHFSGLTQIDTSNVVRLKLAWYGDFDTDRGQEATPIVVGGVLYTSTAWSKVYAYDAATGRQLWTFDPRVPGPVARNACCDVVNRGVAASKGKIYLGTIDARLIALDARTGKPIWSVQTANPSMWYSITGAPRVVKRNVIIGNGGGEFGGRGYISAYDAETGKLAWRFYTTPNPNNKLDGAASDEVLTEKAYSTWGNGAWKQSGGGATVWDTIVYDPDFDQIVFGTGNGFPWSHTARSGKNLSDDLFVASIIAVDADTGVYKWHYQEVPGEEWDFDATQPIALATLSTGGTLHKVLMQASKDGFFYVIDRANGKLIFADQYTPENWAKYIDRKTGRPVEYSDARYSASGTDVLLRPAIFGSHSWHPMAFSPRTGLIYIPAQEAPFGYADDRGFTYKPNGSFIDGTTSSHQKFNKGPLSESERLMLKAMTRGEVIAWDPVRRKEMWRIQHSAIGAGGLLVTAGNLLFQGTPDGVFHAYRADDGREVWTFDSQVGIVSGAMSYAVGKNQYIAVLSGLGGVGALQLPYMDHASAGRGRILVFKLGGTAKLPRRVSGLKSAVVPEEKWPMEVIVSGGKAYANCAVCHGSGAMSNGTIPDLRRSPLLLTKEGWQIVVVGGALESKGMPNFGGTLKAEDAEAIRAWVAQRAAQLRDDESKQ